MDAKDPASAWQDQLIRLYLYVCHHYERELWVHAQRFSNNNQPDFTDEEVLTIYLFGILQKKRTIQQIYDHTSDYLWAWFPQLPGYGAFVQRLNRLCTVFPALVEQILRQAPPGELLDWVRLVDSFPIIMAQQNRSSKARVASEVAQKGYCASKKMYFYGAKLHVIALRRRQRMPYPEYIGLTPGSTNDLTALRMYLPQLHDTELYGDKIYADQALEAQLQHEQNTRLLTPIKKPKGQDWLPLEDRLHSEAVSRVRQPIESLFNWIEEKTGIESASKVRSLQGLLVHVFGRLAAAMFLLVFYP